MQLLRFPLDVTLLLSSQIQPNPKMHPALTHHAVAIRIQFGSQSSCPDGQSSLEPLVLFRDRSNRAIDGIPCNNSVPSEVVGCPHNIRMTARSQQRISHPSRAQNRSASCLLQLLHRLRIHVVLRQVIVQLQPRKKLDHPIHLRYTCSVIVWVRKVGIPCICALHLPLVYPLLYSHSPQIRIHRQRIDPTLNDRPDRPQRIPQLPILRDLSHPLQMLLPIIRPPPRPIRPRK